MQVRSSSYICYYGAVNADNETIRSFVQEVWSYYHDHGRSLPWRDVEPNDALNPYKVLVSEIMLQQTQVGRVITKYHEFLELFPSVHSLAAASLGDVLRVWQGLGYNRRAKFLWQAAQVIISEYDGVFPADQKELTKLPGVGLNTAGAICAYAYNQPVVFVETNIRTVFIHHFFTDRDDVHDKELLPLVAGAVQEVVESKESPREWYWALMDYGSHLKATVGNASRSSRHYAKQSRFEGSRRQIRGQVLRLLTQGAVTLTHLQQEIHDERLSGVLDDLVTESLVAKRGNTYRLAD